MNNNQFVQELSKLRSQSTFLFLKNYKNSHGEIADFNIIFHISYKNSLEKSLNEIIKFAPRTNIENIAKKEIIESFEKSLNKIETTLIEDIDDSYIRFFDDNKKYIKGVKLHKHTNELHLYGFVNKKNISQPGVYLVKNKKELTEVKDKLKENLTVSRFRQFILTPDKVDLISVQKLNLLPPSE